MLLLPIPGSLSSCLHSIASFRFVSVLGTSCSFVAGCKCPLLVCMTALTGSWSLNSFSSYGACRGSAVPLSQLDVLLTVCSPDHCGSTVSPHMWGIEGYPRGGPHKRVAQESQSVEITRHVCSIIDQLRTKRTAEGWRCLAHRTLAHIGKPSYGENLITRTRPLTHIQTPGAGSWVLTHPRTVDTLP